MTLIVSLSTPDGIVIAGDSLSTMMSNKLLEADFTVQCQSCQQNNIFRGRVPNVYSSNTLSLNIAYHNLAIRESRIYHNFWYYYLSAEIIRAPCVPRLQNKVGTYFAQ